MIGVIMAGGKGSRMNLPGEKLLLEYKKPVVLHVVSALKNSGCFSKIIALTSSNSPKTKKLLEENNVELLDTSGVDYVTDLNFALKSFNDYVLITSADLPLLDEEIIQKIVNSVDSKKTWTSILVTKKFLESIHISSDYEITFENQQCVYTGISLVNAKHILNLEKVSEDFKIIDDKRIAFNLNTKHDYRLLSTT